MSDKWFDYIATSFGVAITREGAVHGVDPQEDGSAVQIGELAALLADAVRRVREERAEDWSSMKAAYAVIDERIVAVEKRANTGQSMILSLSTQLGEEAAERSLLSDRVAALERAMPYAKSPLDPEPALHLPDAVTKIRRNLAREIVGRLRSRSTGLSYKDSWNCGVADWIEREYGASM